MLRQAHDRRVRAGLQIRQRCEVAVLGLLDIGIDGPAVRTAVRMPEPLLDPLHHVVGERVPEQVGLHVRLRGRVAHEVREQPLDDPVLAHDALRALATLRRQQRLLVLASLDQTFALESLQHLAGRRARHAEHLRHSRRERGRPAAKRAVLADRKGEEVDRLQVLVDGMSLRHSADRNL